MLSPAQRQFLKSLAHALNVVTLIGEKGLSESVLKEIENALKAHELLKIKAASGDRVLREHWLEEICTHTGAEAVQHIGKTLVIYRPGQPQKITLPG
jgi:RNA-binding protein